MRLNHRAVIIVLALASSMTLTGCIENMDDLKEALGVGEPIVAAAIYAPPIAAIDLVNAPALLGAPVRFSAEKSQDPQALPLLYAWDFGDGSLGSGATASHTYAHAGALIVKLVVTNAAGLVDDDSLALNVAVLDRAPTVGLRAPATGTMSEPVAFEAFASDPEGSPLVIDWAFGDGATLTCDQGECQKATQHTYEKPGVYDVRVSATDPSGNVARSNARIAVDGVWRADGAFVPAGADSDKLMIPIVAGARGLDITLTFDAGPGGINDLEVVALGADGEEVARSDGGFGSASTRTLRLADQDLAAGTWTIRVVKEMGVSAAWTLNVVESLS